MNVSDQIDRHLNGERVTTEYVHRKTGETIQVLLHAEPPEGYVPAIGEVNASDKLVRELPEAEQLEALELIWRRLDPADRERLYVMARMMWDQASGVRTEVDC